MQPLGMTQRLPLRVRTRQTWPFRRRLRGECGKLPGAMAINGPYREETASPMKRMQEKGASRQAELSDFHPSHIRTSRAFRRLRLRDSVRSRKRQKRSFLRAAALQRHRERAALA